MSETRNKVIAQLESLGWPRHQAVGIAANLKKESEFNPNARGDKDPKTGQYTAFGIAQWRGSRLADFQAWAGRPLQGSTLEQQVAFLDYEARQGKEKRAGDKVRAATTAAAAAAAFSTHFERPRDTVREERERGAQAAAWMGEPTPPPQKAQQGPSEPAGDANGRPVLSRYQSEIKPVLGPSEASQELARIEAQRRQIEAGDTTGPAEQVLALQNAQRAAEVARPTAGLTDVFQTSRQDPQDQITLSAMNALARDEEDADTPPDWTYEANRDEIEAPCGASDDCREYMRENVRGPGSMRRAHAENMVRQDMDRTYADAGALNTFIGRMGGSMLDPVAFGASLGIGKVLHSAWRGVRGAQAAGVAATTAAQYRVGGVAVSALEGGLGNVAVETMQDAMGEVKTSSDYVMAFAAGGIMSAPFARGSISRAINEDANKLLADIQRNAVREQEAKVVDFMERTGESDPVRVARGVEAEEARAVAETVADGNRQGIRESVVPEAEQARIRKEYEEPDIPARDPAADPARDLEPHELAGAKAPEPKPEPPTPADGTAAPEVPQVPNPRLPPELSKAPPRYSDGEKQIDLAFESDLDRAAYIVAGAGDSGTHAPFVAWAEANGYTERGLIARGKTIRAAIEKAAKDAEVSRLVFSDGVTVPAREAGGKAATPEQAKEPGVLYDKAGRPSHVDTGAPAEGHTARSVLDAILKENQELTPARKAVVQYLRKVLGDDLLDSTKVVAGAERSSISRRTGNIEVEGGRNGSVSDVARALDGRGVDSLMHELIHAATMRKMDLYLADPALVAPNLRAAILQLDDLRLRVKRQADLKYGFERATGRTADALEARAGELTGSERIEYVIRYGTKDIHEFAAQSITDPIFRDFLKRIEGLPVAGKPTSAWRSFINGLAALFGKGDETPNALAEAGMLVDRIISTSEDGIVAKMTGDLYSPASSAASRTSWAQAYYTKATDYLLRKPIDETRLGVLTAKIKGGMSDGLVLARSKNPIMQMISSLVTETTTGAAGRGANVAIAREFTFQRIMGNTMLDYNNAFDSWASRNGGALWDTAFVGAKRREFDKLVTLEMLNRKDRNYIANADISVREAADATEKLFERAAREQRQAGTLGSANLPDTSRGYLPRAGDGAKIQTLSVQDLAAVHDLISTQLQSNMGWDKAFSDMFAPYYFDRIRQRAQGAKGIDQLSAGGNSSTIIRDTLEDMAIDPATRDRMLASESKGGLKHTKARLDLDLRQEYAPGKQLLDVFVTDPMLLARSYAQQTAGSVALAEQGILGIRGIRELRAAAGTPTEQHALPTAEEFAAFDRVVAEIMGTSVDRVESAGATNLRLLVSLQRLGGLVFTQAAETFNALHILGVRSLVSGVSDIARHISDARNLAKGGTSKNPFLRTVDAYTGEIGMSNYKTVAPLDAPDALLEDYAKQPGIISRILRGGGHIQARVSFFQGLMAAQHRMMATEVIKKALRYINEGGHDKYLADMGFTPELVEALRPEIDSIATWSGRKPTGFDLTKVSDPRIAEAMMQAVHRGVGQIIQGTFIGERNAWANNDYMRLFLQLRTFGITATEKQLQRTAMIQGGGIKGYAYAGGLLMGQMAIAVPLHTARVQLAAAAMEDDAREKYLADNLSAAALARASMNYASLSGIGGDVLEMTSAMAGGWMGEEGKEVLGVRTGQSTSVGRLIPAAGTIDSAFKVASGNASLYTGLRQLPFNSLWYLSPFVAMSKE